jgi:hypothetical protein
LLLDLLEAVEADPVWVCLAARCALHFERVVVWIGLSVVWAEVCHANEFGTEGEGEDHGIVLLYGAWIR